jgi:hypothetical protein
MTPQISLDNQTLDRLRREGEVEVQDAHGIPLVVMTVDAREKLEKLVYDDSEWSEQEMLAAASQQLDDPEGWGAPGMEVYDELYGDKPTDDGKDQ